MQFRDPISVEQQVACTLYYLADEGRSRKVSNAFGIGKSTASKIVRRVSKTISVHLAPKYSSLPICENKIVKLVEQFYEAHGLPQCIGAIDGTYIRIKKTVSNPTDYINRKGIYGLNVQAAVDYKFCFFDVIVEWPGSVHDARVFSNSYLKLRDASIPKCIKTIVPGEPAVPICHLAILRTLCYHILERVF